MNVTFWGTRGSLASPGPETTRYGGNTSCVEVQSPEGTVLVLDAGTGIRRLGSALPHGLRRVDLLLTHLHMDHIQGLGFFAPLYTPDVDVHIWGPTSLTQDLRTRLQRYLSPPLFPVHMRDLPCKLSVHEITDGAFEVGEFRIMASLVSHPGPTVGYRITSPDATLTYLPDHEPSLGCQSFPTTADWTSGYTLANGADLLIHDAQYGTEEYDAHVGWGHSSLVDAMTFATMAGVKHLVAFHHAPEHSDADIDRMFAETLEAANPPFPVTPAAEGMTMELCAPRGLRSRRRSRKRSDCL